MNFFIFIERWGLARGCDDCGLINSGRTGEKGLKRQPWGGGSIQTIRDCMGEGVEEDLCIYCSSCPAPHPAPHAAFSDMMHYTDLQVAQVVTSSVVRMTCY